MTTEANIQRLIMLEASRRGLTLWRNNTGQAWQGTGKPLNLNGAWVTLAYGRRFKVERGILLREPRPVRFGLCEGSSDLIGLRKVTITPEMVGQTLAVFTAIEVKAARGRATGRQKAFTKFVQDAGGIGLIARSADDLPGEA